MAIARKNIPIWQTDAFIVLMLIVFSPVGVFLAWKYTKWRTWVKLLLSIFFLLPLILVLGIYLIFGSVFLGLKGASKLDSALNPRVVNQSTNYSCVQVSPEWNKCTSNKYKVSFEYPADWHYVDFAPSSEGIGFGTTSENLIDNWIISFSPYVWNTAEEAAKMTKPHYSSSSKHREYTIKGRYADQNEVLFRGEPDSLGLIVRDGKNQYNLYVSLNKIQDGKHNITEQELREIFDHMVSSFDFVE